MNGLRENRADDGEHGYRGKPLPDIHTIFLPLKTDAGDTARLQTAELSLAPEWRSNMPFADNPLRDAAFVLAAHRLDQLPPDEGAEIAFVGRSNAGKSSALNALVGHGRLARTSKTPGRTQQLVVFALPGGARLIDLPGYGYAKVPVALREHWCETIDAYLRTRRSLRGLVLITDIRHALKAFDEQMLGFCAAIQLPCVVLLSKADKLSRAQALMRQREVHLEIAELKSNAHTLLFSATAGTGVDAARGMVVELLDCDDS